MTPILPTTQYTAFPLMLREQPNWVCWKFKDTEGKKTKVPYNPKTGCGAKANEPSTWNSFEYVCSQLTSNENIYDGIGFEFTKGLNIVGIDIDHCVDAGKIKNDAIKQLVDMTDSYCEYSPSGTGIHIYVAGIWPDDLGHKKNLDDGIAIEVYSNKRYFTVTGNTYSGHQSAVTDGTDLLAFIQEHYFALSTNKTQNRQNPEDIDDESKEELYADNLQWLFDHNQTFAALFCGQRINDDESSNDMSLLCWLAAVMNGDIANIRMVFLKSPYVESKDKQHKQKLEREDYLNRSIRNAIEYVKENRGHYLIGEEDMALLSYEYNDMGNADRLLALYHNQVKYCSQTDTWYVYDGKRWFPDANRYRLRQCCGNLYTTMQRIVHTIEDEDDRKNKLKLIKRLGEHSAIGSMIKMAEIKEDIPQEIFNQHDDILAADNGIVDLKTGELLSYDPQYYITFKSSINYNPEAPEPQRFLKFMDEIFKGDAALINYVHRMLGYCLTGSMKEQVFFIFHGAGSNGKGVLLKLLRRMFSEIFVPVAAGSFLSKKDENRPNPSLIQAKDSRMVIINETNRNAKLDTALIKAISGQDSIKGRSLYHDDVEINPHFKIVFATNHLPDIDWEDYGMRRRYRLIPFNVVFQGERRDNNLSDTLWSERESIFRWMVEGAIEWYNHGLGNIPNSVTAILEEARIQEDTFYGFCKERLSFTDNTNDKIQASKLYENYCTWCVNRNIDDEKRLTSTSFGKRMSHRTDKKAGGHDRCVYYHKIKYSNSKAPDMKSNV